MMKRLSGRVPKLLQDVIAWRDTRGTSAIEFALLAPSVFFMYLATFEIGRMVTIDRRVESVASTAADLIAQVKTVDNAALDNICDASNSIIDQGDPLYSGVKPKIVLSSVVADQNNNGKVAWSYSSPQHCNGGSTHAPGSLYALPPGTTVPNSSVIVAEVTFAGTRLDIENVSAPTVEIKIFSPSATVYARPRRSLTVAKN